MHKKLITTALILPITVQASLIDSRSAGMGGVGAASADYLAASFHNPALAASHLKSDNFGILLPTVGIRVRDGDSLYTQIDDFQSHYQAIKENPYDNLNIEQWKVLLEKMDNSTIDIDVSAGIVIAIPNNHLSFNLFTAAETATLAIAEVDETDLDIRNPNVEPVNSTVHGVAGATLNVGFTIAKEITLKEILPIKVGFSPKYQQIYALNYKSGIDAFDANELDLNSDVNKSSGFNFDLGVSYNISENVRFGVYGKNIISNSIESKDSLGTKATYLVEPEYKAGFAYNSHLYSFAVDVDLNERKYFKEYGYSTQAASLGGELNAWDWAQLRVGYIYSLTDSQDDLITAGIGLKPFGMFGIDLAGQYGKDNNIGASAQIIFQI